MDPTNYTIDPEDLIRQRLTDRLNLEQGIPGQAADLEARNPQTTAMPNATAEAQGIATPQQIDYTMQNLQNRFNPPQPTQPQLSPEEQVKQYSEQFAANPEAALVSQGLNPMVAKELAKQLNDSGPPKLVGKDIFGENRGGIMGTGITPLGVLAHAFGALITRRLPQQQAVETTLAIGGLPEKYRLAQQKAGAAVIAETLKAAEGSTTASHVALLNKQYEALQQKQSAMDIVGQLADNKQPIPAALAIRAGVPPAVALGMQTGHWSIQNTDSGLVAVNTADPTKTIDLGMNKAAGGAVNINTVIDQAAQAQGLKPGTPEYTKYFVDQTAAAQGAKSGASAAAQQPYKIQIVTTQAGARGEENRKTIDYRIKAMGDAPVTEKTAPLWVNANGQILPGKDIIGKAPSEILGNYPDAVRLASPMERNQLASATSLPELRNKIAPLLPEILQKYGGNNLSDILSVQGNKLTVKLKGAAGDPKIARAQALLTDFLVETPLAMGMVAGREGPELLKRYEAGMPGMGSTVQSALSAMDANIESVASRWLARGVDITRGMSHGAQSAGGTGQPPPGARIRRLNPNGVLE